MTLLTGIIGRSGGSAGAAYQGAGDIVSSASMWWGVRAYNAAAIGTNAIRLRESGGNTEQDFTTVSGGGLDLAAILTFRGGNSVFVTKLYDQTGNGKVLLQSTAGLQPELQFNILGTLPSIRFTASSSMVLTTADIGSALTLPITCSLVAKLVAAGTQCITIGNDNAGGQPNVYYTAGSNMYNGSAASVATGDNAFHTRQNVFSDVAANSVLCLDGVDNTVNCGNGAGLQGVVSIGGNGFGQPFNSFINEVGWWPIAFTAPNNIAMDSNQRTYWGF